MGADTDYSWISVYNSTIVIKKVGVAHLGLLSFTRHYRGLGRDCLLHAKDDWPYMTFMDYFIKSSQLPFI